MKRPLIASCDLFSGVTNRHSEGLHFKMLDKLADIILPSYLSLDAPWTYCQIRTFLNIKLSFFSYLSIQTCVLGAQKNRLIERVLLSTHNICFG